MAIGVKDPVLGVPVMTELRKSIRGCPEPYLVQSGGHFLQEWGEDVAAAAQPDEPPEAVAGFLRLSVILTGFEKYELLGTGMLMPYYDELMKPVPYRMWVSYYLLLLAATFQVARALPLPFPRLLGVPAPSRPHPPLPFCFSMPWTAPAIRCACRT